MGKLIIGEGRRLRGEYAARLYARKIAPEARLTIEEDVLAANERFYQAFNLKDAALMDAIWASEHDVTCVHPGWNVLEGGTDVLDSWHSILSNPNQPRIVSGGATATVFGDLAVVVCRELVAGSPLVATNIFVLEAGAWKLLHHHSGPVYTQAQ